MAFTPVRPNDPLDQPSHSGLHNQHSTDIEALQEFYASLAGGDVGEVLAKTSGDDYDYDWLPGGTGGGDGGDYPGISTEDPNGLGLGTDGGLRVEPSDLLSDNAGQQLTVTPDDGKLHMAYQIVDAVPDDSDGEVGDVVFIPGGPGGLPAVGGGKVLQVVSEARKAAVEVTTTEENAASLGYPCTITVQENSRLLVIAWATWHGANVGGLWGNTAKTLLFLDGVVVAKSEHDGVDRADAQTGTQSINYVSDPLPAGTYTVDVCGCLTIGASPITFNRSAGAGNLIVMEVAA